MAALTGVTSNEPIFVPPNMTCLNEAKSICVSKYSSRDGIIHIAYVSEVCVAQESAKYGHVLTGPFSHGARNRLPTVLCPRFRGEHIQVRGERDHIHDELINH